MKGIKNEPLPTYVEFCEYCKEKGIMHVCGLQFYCDYIYLMAFDDWMDILYEREQELIKEGTSDAITDIRRNS